MAELDGIDKILGNCLHALEGGQGLAEVLARYPEHAQELKPLLEAALWFGSQKVVVEPRAGFVRASRARLLEKIAAEPLVAGNWLERTWGQVVGSLGAGWRVALQVGLVVVMLACLVVGSSGVAVASQDALPGDALHPVKLGLEQVELLVTLDPAADIQLHTQFSQSRLVEIQELVMQGRYNYVRETVSNFEAHVNRASQLLSALARQDPVKAKELAIALKETLTSQRSFLRFLMAAVPPEVAPEMLRALGIAAGGEVAVQAVLDQAGSTDSLTATPTLLDAAGEDVTATLAIQRSAETPNSTLLPSPTLPVTSTSTLAPYSATPSSTLAPTFTRTLAPTRTPTPVPQRENPLPTYTSRPPTQPPPTEPPPPEETDEPQPEKTKKPPPTRRPPKP